MHKNRISQDKYEQWERNKESRSPRAQPHRRLHPKSSCGDYRDDTNRRRSPYLYPFRAQNVQHIDQASMQMMKAGKDPEDIW